MARTALRGDELISVPNNYITQHLFTHKNFAYLNRRVDEEIYKLIGYHIGKFDYIQLRSQLMLIYTRFLNLYINGFRFENYTDHEKFAYVNEIIVQDLTNDALNCIATSIQMLINRYNRQRPYNLEESITTPDKIIAVSLTPDTTDIDYGIRNPLNGSRKTRKSRVVSFDGPEFGRSHGKTHSFM